MAIISTEGVNLKLNSAGSILANATADLLASSDFISRTIGMNNSYEDIMFIVQALGREPISLLGKDYLFIYDHVRRIYQQGTSVPSIMYGGGEYGCPKFTFYKGRPTIRFADVMNDPLNLLARIKFDFKPGDTKASTTNRFYAESNDDEVNNKIIDNVSVNEGVATGQYSTSFQNLSTCDMLKKTNDNFNFGRYNTLISRFHTNNPDSMDDTDGTQTAISKTYGMSHGRNLLLKDPKNNDRPNGYDNPYCRVWTHHHQYNKISRAIRPFDVDYDSQKKLEEAEFGGLNRGGFRTVESKKSGIAGGSIRLDTHGVLNYENGFVNIAPTAKIKDYFEHKADDKERKSVSTKRCMFSIENLAWRDTRAKNDQFDSLGLSPEQRGPLGGRIMWFPPYDLTFSESVNVKWNSNEFIGRGENVYTYTNTERKGVLSFTLLIDHPSILDYWTGHERNGMKNKNKDLLPGNTYGVDGVDGLKGNDNQENTLLRFFAGCDILTAKPQEYWVRSSKLNDNEPEEEPHDIKDNVDTPEVAKPAGKQTMVCVLYFPNNYSGVNDKVGSKLSAVHYLMNGVGTQYYIYEEDGVSYKREIPTSITSKFSRGGGYEVTDSVTIVRKPVNSSARASTYTDDHQNEYITDENGNKITVTRDGNNYPLAKIVGSKAKSYEQINNKLWHERRWYYRVDEGIRYCKNNDGKSKEICDTYENDNLTKPESYLDYGGMTDTCYMLNRGGYKKATGETSSIKEIIESGVDNKDNLHLISFADLFYALESENTVIQAADMDNVRLVQEIMNADKNGISIKNISYTGCASKAGHNEGNAKLAKNRARTFKEWAVYNKFPEKGTDDANDDKVGTYPLTSVNNGIASSLTAKLDRCAILKVDYEYVQEQNAQTTDSAVQTSGTGENKAAVIDTDTGAPLEKVTKYTNNKDVLTARDWLYNTDEGREVLKKGYPVEEEVTIAGRTTKVTTYKPIDPWTFTMADAAKITGKDYFNKYAFKYDNTYQQLSEEEQPNLNSDISSGVVKRYDNEGEFFELLDRESPFLHHLITDKIKYFDPAFHSISPEGFNARLTFLHQCTRQGSTIGNSDDGEIKTAYNLAFGRPPVCVLRIGDFYYTKIIIDSITIKYDRDQWDMNPEGIGMMPMFASIDMTFTFLGGSDLAGPIARLQNAVSFNYYANTSVYDNRAERVEYDPSGNGKEIKYKAFKYPSQPTYIVDEYTGSGKILRVDSDGEVEDS